METRTVTCPDPICGTGQIIIPDHTTVGDILECPECGAEVEVQSLDPIAVELILEEK